MEPTSPPAKLPYAVYLDAVAANAASFAEVLRATPADVRVPSCPEWSLGELGAHAADFAAFYTHAICDRTGATRPPWPNTWRHAAASPLNGEAPATYFDERVQFLLSLLRSTAPDAEVRTWARDDQTAHFVARRSAHELAVHRFDAQLAAGEPESIDARLAADGIEEIFVMLKYLGAGVGQGGGAGEILQIRSTDQSTDWVIVLRAGVVEVRREPAPADLKATGTASDLELLLYARSPIGQVEFVGDNAVLDAWYRTFTFT